MMFNQNNENKILLPPPPQCAVIRGSSAVRVAIDVKNTIAIRGTVRVQTVQPFFHYKSENENGITIRYPFLYFSIKKTKMK